MPIYIFRCASCGATVEKIQSYASAPPDCGAGPHQCFGSPMERVPSAGSFTFGEGKKGSFVGEAIKRVKKAGL